VVGTSIDIETWRPRLTNNKGGLTGPAIKPIALAMVNAVHEASSLPIIGIGGISEVRDAVEFFLAGASALQIGTALFIEPHAPIRIAQGLREYLERKELASIGELVGRVRKY
jgi:dihydroorotate dehydrogenase (NAD+) catalytic subunit